MTETGKPGGFLKGFGSGAIIVLVVAVGYIFGFDENPKDAVTDAVQEAYVVAALGEKSVAQLKATLPDLSPKQEENLKKTEEALGNVRAEAERIALLFKIALPPLPEETALPAEPSAETVAPVPSD